MLKQQAKLLNRIAIAVDMLAIMVALAMASYVMSRHGVLGNIKQYRWIFLIAVPVWYFLFAYYDLYGSLRTRSFTFVFSSVLKVHVYGAMVTAAFIYLFAPQDFSRMFFCCFIFFSLVLICLEKTVLKHLLAFIRRRGYNFRNILIVGTNADAQLLAQLVKEYPNWGLRIVGFLYYGKKPETGEFSGYKILGQFNDFRAVIRLYAIDEVVFCLPREHMAEVEAYLPETEEMGITFRMVLDSCISRSRRKQLDYFNDQLPILTVYAKPFNAGQQFLKRFLDVAGSLVGLGITALIFPFIAVAIRMETAGPLLFGQLRVGENGRLFRCWKFRSMYVDAEERKRELLHLNEMHGAIFKIRDDPRITKVGKFLRKASLDELPQFWNVLRGEMSLVGTRPPTPDEVTNYKDWHHKRICIKPGITGMWQVSGRNEIKDFDEVVRLDIEYIDKWSLWLDLKILFKTIWVVFIRNGSY